MRLNYSLYYSNCSRGGLARERVLLNFGPEKGDLIERVLQNNFTASKLCFIIIEG